jgi:hypothetical protein
LDAAVPAFAETDGALEIAGFAAADLAAPDPLGLATLAAAEPAATGFVDGEAATAGDAAGDDGAAPDGTAAVPAWPQAARTKGSVADSRLRFIMSTTINHSPAAGRRATASKKHSEAPG